MLGERQACNAISKPRYSNLLAYYEAKISEDTVYRTMSIPCFLCRF